jgi:F-type H+-transporting ATPase subunit alpha
MEESRLDFLLSDISKKIKEGEYQFVASLREEGRVTYVGTSVLKAVGLPKSFMGEILKVGENAFAYVFGFKEDGIQLILLSKEANIKVGDPVKRTGIELSIPVGRALLGRIVDPTGKPLDGRGDIATHKTRPLEKIAPSVIERIPVNKPLYTGIKVIDAIIPIGKGQRELIIGDRQTGKTSILLDTIINQKDKNVICIYVAIAQRASNVAGVIDALRANDALDNTIFVVSLANDPPSVRYLAPFSGTAIAEYFAEQGKDVLIVYDDLNKHADSYRELSLLLRRPPGREAYPSDIFYLHSRLLERAGNFTEKLGGGSITALPVVETQEGDISQYIPTNLISITDGQIYLEKNLFNIGIRPAVNVGLSVSRVGSSAQSKAMKQVSKGLRLDLSQYADLKAFTEFGTELKKETKLRLHKGELLTEILKQKNGSPLSPEKEVLIFFAYTSSMLDDIPIEQIHNFESDLFDYILLEAPHIFSTLLVSDEINEELASIIKKTIEAFKYDFFARLEGED